MCNMPPDAPGRDSVFMLHNSFGLTIVGLTIVRLIWRALCPAPAYPHQIAHWERATARATYLLLYCVLHADQRLRSFVGGRTFSDRF